MDTSFGLYVSNWYTGDSTIYYNSKVEFNKPTPKRVIFNPPATIVYWKDGTKTVVKCSENEEFIPEVGLAMAFIRKIYPNRSEFLKFLEDAYYQDPDLISGYRSPSSSENKY